MERAIERINGCRYLKKCDKHTCSVYYYEHIHKISNIATIYLLQLDFLFKKTLISKDLFTIYPTIIIFFFPCWLTIFDCAP